MAMSQIRVPKTPREGLLNNVLFYISQRGYEALSACELALGVIAVEDSYGEVDVFFNDSMWKFSHPEQWVRPGFCTSPVVGIGLLQGIGTNPYVRTLGAALPFAKRNLSTLQSIEWFPQPRMFPT